MDKYEAMHPTSLLEPLPIPEFPWTNIFLDFVAGLSTLNGFSVVLSVIDRLTKHAHFFPLALYNHQSCSSFLYKSIQVTWHAEIYSVW